MSLHLELTDAEKQALDAFPTCSVSHWIRGEKLNFETDEWEAIGLLGTENPDHYDFIRGSGSGGKTTEEVFECQRCNKYVRLSL